MISKVRFESYARRAKLVRKIRQDQKSEKQSFEVRAQLVHKKEKNMSRALWKGPFVDTCLLRGRTRRVWSRRSMILPEFVDDFFEIHNGKEFLRVRITEEMVGHRFGEFASTRRKTIHPTRSKSSRS